MNIDGDPAEASPASGPGSGEPLTDERDEAEAQDDEVDEMSKQTFPTSDPPSTWAGSDNPKPT